MKKQLIDKFENRDALIAVIGLGYVGLPLAVAFAQRGFTVVGIDSNQERVRMINVEMKSYINDVPNSHISVPVRYGRLYASADYSDIKDADAVILCVPTPVIRSLPSSSDPVPDLSFIIAAAEGIAQQGVDGKLISLESTTYPGTTKEVLLPILDEAGGEIGHDWFLAYSPERIDPGRHDYGAKNTPKVVGGVNDASLYVAAALYDQVTYRVVRVTSAKTAEMTKLLENTFRMINIGFINEFAMACNSLGVDVYEVIDAAATKPFGFMPFCPGAGVGGHCVPVDPHYLSWKLEQDEGYPLEFVELADGINSQMPAYVVQKIGKALRVDGKYWMSGAKILVLGVTYKPDVADTRNSPAFDVIRILDLMAANISFHDFYVDSIQVGDKQFDCVVLSKENLANADCVVVLAPHMLYDFDMISRHSRIIVDVSGASGKENSVWNAKKS